MELLILEYIQDTATELMPFLAWINENEASWFTDYGQAEYNNFKCPPKTYKGGMDGEATECKTDSNCPC
jgi:hypothetical protein